MSGDCTLRIWKADAGKWEPLCFLKLDETLYSVSWSKHSDNIAVCGEQNAITILQLTQQNLHVVKVLEDAHGIHDVNHVSWCPQSSNANLLASCGDDGLVKIWTL